MCEKYLFDDESLFVGKACIPRDITKDKRLMPAKPKRTRTELPCKHCERLSTHLYFNIGCTAECTLAFVFRNCSSDDFNIIYIHFFDQTKQHLIPRRAPTVGKHESSKQYWERVLPTIYDLGDLRMKILVTRLNETCPFKTVINCDRPSIKESLVVKKKKY